MNLARLLGSSTVVVIVAGCVPAPRGPVDLRNAEVRQIRFALRHPRAAICPGEPVKLDVSMDVKVNGEELTVAERRDELDEPIFSLGQLYLQSPQGRFEDGTFIPDADARASLGSGFVFYARAPRGPAFSIRFPPYYECGGRIGGSGVAGRRGTDRSEPNPESPVRASLDEAVGGAWSNASIDGARGGAGPHLTVFVTWVETPDYAKVLAGRSRGDIDMLTLAAPGYPLNVIAVGGRGGDGGRGEGGTTGGGRGGTGGTGGTGGDGGDVEVVLDERFTELAGYVNIDVQGGEGGAAGGPGPGGDRETVVERRSRGTSSVPEYVKAGTQGRPGLPGVVGRRGATGTFRIRTGSVRESFEGVAGLRML